MRNSNNFSELWKSLNWRKIRKTLFRLQVRLFKAIRARVESPRLSGAGCGETRTPRSNREVRGIIPSIDSTVSYELPGISLAWTIFKPSDQRRGVMVRYAPLEGWSRKKKLLVNGMM